MAQFKQTEFKGYNNEGLNTFYQNEYNNAKDMGYSDEKAHAHAEFMVEYYGHQFRRYA